MNIDEVLRDDGFEFKKKFGQNFITDKNLLCAICDDAGIEPCDGVLEIGVGAGTLTKVLSQRASRVVGYEVDKSLQNILGQTLKGCNNVTINFKDFLKASPSEVNLQFDGEYKVVANLPYYITTDIIIALLEKDFAVKSLTLMVQKEVAERICSKPGTKEYGTISAEIDAVGTAQIKRIVNRQMFTPTPNVDSAVVHVVLDKNKFAIKDLQLFRKLVRVAFSMRRKTLANCLKSGMAFKANQIEALFCKLGLNKDVRGETLTTRQFVDMSNLIFEMKNF